MTTKIKQIKKEIERLSEKERVQLLDGLGDSLEDYLLSKIAYQRSLRDSGKRHSWESIKRQSGSFSGLSPA